MPGHSAPTRTETSSKPPVAPPPAARRAQLPLLGLQATAGNAAVAETVTVQRWPDWLDRMLGRGQGNAPQPQVGAPVPGAQPQGAPPPGNLPAQPPPGNAPAQPAPGGESRFGAEDLETRASQLGDVVSLGQLGLGSAMQAGTLTGDAADGVMSGANVLSDAAYAASFGAGAYHHSRTFGTNISTATTGRGVRQKLARDRSVNSGLLGFGNIVLTGSSLSQVAGDTGQAFKWKPGFLLDSIGGGLQALGSLPGIGVHIYKASTGWWRQRNLAKQPGQEAAAIAASLTAFNEKHGQFEKNVRDSSSWKDSLARRIDQRDRVRNDVVDVQQRHDSIANAVRDVKSKVSSEDPSLERRAEEGERLLLRAQVELRAANDRGMRSEQQVADARTERARLLATQEITAPLVTRAEEHAEAMRRYMTEPLDAHAKAGTQLHLSDVRDRLRTANARRLKAGSLGAFNTSLQAAGGLVNVPMNKGMKRNIKDTQGYANIGTDITAANAAADLAEIQYRKGGATEEHRETTARVLYTSLGRGAAHPPVPAVPAADAIDRLVGQRAAVIAQDTPENVRDMADVVRPALSDPTVKSLEKPLMADKGWSMLEHIGIPRTDVDQADVPDDVIEYVKASIPDD